MRSQVSESEFRVAIHQTHRVATRRLAEVVAVEIRRRDAPAWRGSVHVFEISGHARAKRCFAWPQAVNRTTTIIHAVLETDKVRTAEQAVRARLRTDRRRRLQPARP